MVTNTNCMRVGFSVPYYRVTIGKDVKEGLTSSQVDEITKGLRPDEYEIEHWVRGFGWVM